MASLLKPVPDRVYPFWPPGGTNQGQSALARAVGQTIQDLPLNQIPGGSALEIPIIQRLRPRQTRPTGAGLDEERGTTSGNLYDSFMSYYNQPKGGAR